MTQLPFGQRPAELFVYTVTIVMPHSDAEPYTSDVAKGIKTRLTMISLQEEIKLEVFQ